MTETKLEAAAREYREAMAERERTADALASANAARQHAVDTDIAAAIRLNGAKCALLDLASEHD